MSDQQPICIRRTNTLEEAELIIAWLEDAGVKASILDAVNPGVFAFGVTDPEGIAVYVANEETAERAKALLAEHDQEMARRSASAESVIVQCEECGATNTFKAADRGTVQECAECGAYVDVPE